LLSRREVFMSISKYHNYSLDELEKIEENWEIKSESEEEPDFRQDWVEKGIEIYESLVSKRVSDEKKSIYYRNLASLYLEYGRSEKMIEGNFVRAFQYLRRAAHYLPEKGDSFYHLAFLVEKMTIGRERWESAAFYAKEALERGIVPEKQIKIWCLLGKAYFELGLQKDAARCFSLSKKLDHDDDFARFRAKYSKGDNEKTPFTRLNQVGTRMNQRAERDHWIEKSRRGDCYVLEIERRGRGTTLYGNGAFVVMNTRDAELIRLLFDWGEGLNKYEILQNTVNSINKKPESIKTDISRLRAVIKKGLAVDGKTLIQNIVDKEDNNRYRWNPTIPKHLID
jgi:tetratricopeptide (TPR) repeat protein